MLMNLCEGAAMRNGEGEGRQAGREGGGLK